MSNKQPQSFSDWFNSIEIQKRVNRISNVYDEQIKKLAESLTDEMASDIKKWRLGDGSNDSTVHSWRSLACEFYDKYEPYAREHSIDYGNQISGMQLCEAAVIKLKEEGWN